MRIEILTFFRFIAALVVVVFHFNNDWIATEGFWVSGPEMVTFFFVLSGFVLSVSAAALDQPGGLLYFYWCRVARIVPLFYFAAFVFVAIKAANGQWVSWKQLLLHLSFAQAWVPGYGLVVNAPGWSLSAEMFFYAVFPLAYWVLSAKLSLKQGLFSVVSLWLLSVLGSTWLLNYAPPSRELYQFVLYFPLLHLCSFCLGVWAGIFYRQNPDFIVTKARHLFAVVLVAVLTLEWAPVWLKLVPLALPSATNLYAVLFLAVVLVAAYCRSPWLAPLSSRIAVLLGNASYGVYILHYPVYLVFYYGLWGDGPAPTRLAFLQYLSVLIVVSIALYITLEKPSNKVLRRLGKGLLPSARAAKAI